MMMRPYREMLMFIEKFKDQIVLSHKNVNKVGECANITRAFHSLASWNLLK